MIVFIYYPLRERLTADLLRDLIIQDWPDAKVSALIDKLVDEHPLPQFRCELADHHSNAFATWISTRHGTLSVQMLSSPGESQWLGREL